MSKTPKEEIPETPVKQCYKFIENTQVGNDLFLKGECIELEESELELFWPYVKKCDGKKSIEDTGTQPCKTC